MNRLPAQPLHFRVGRTSIFENVVHLNTLIGSSPNAFEKKIQSDGNLY